jgi:membrane-bound lytic murein transglycosylase F
MWKNYKILGALVFIIASIFEVKQCTLPPWALNKNGADSNLVQRDLDKITKSRKLVLLTENNSTSYFIYRGTPMGYEYEMVDSFAHSIGAELEVVVVNNIDNIFKMLDSGMGDIAADNLTITNSRRKDADFTSPLFTTRQVLIQRKPDDWRKLSAAELERSLVKNTLQLADKQVYVRKSSSFYERLHDLSNEIGGKIDIIEVPGNESTEELIAEVAKGKIDYTIADENIARIMTGFYDNLDVSTSVSFPQKISWAVRQSSPELLNSLNEWLRKDKKKHFRQIVYDKYFSDKKFASLRQTSEYSSIAGGRISMYDELIKKYSSRIGWDWRLIVSQIYEESQFDPHAQSWSGAYGLMQTLPSTSNIDSADMTPEKSIAAGIDYLKQIDTYWVKLVNDDQERIAFDLASYDVGIGHVIDAKNLAAKYGLDPAKWENNVAYFLLNESNPKYYNDPIVQYGYCRGQEPYQYVREILNRYQMYCNQQCYKPQAIVNNNKPSTILPNPTNPL